MDNITFRDFCWSCNSVIFKPITECKKTLENSLILCSIAAQDINWESYLPRNQPGGFCGTWISLTHSLTHSQNPSLKAFGGFFGGGRYFHIADASGLQIVSRFQTSVSRLLFFHISIIFIFSFAKAFPEALSGKVFLFGKSWREGGERGLVWWAG